MLEIFQFIFLIHGTKLFILDLVFIFYGEIFICRVLPLIHVVALCCNCMMTVLPLLHSLILISSRCIYSVMQMYSERDAVAALHPLCLFYWED